MELKENIVSVLKLKHIYIEKFNFERKTYIDQTSLNPRISITKDVNSSDKENAKVSLSVTIVAEDTYSLMITLVGIFSLAVEETEAMQLLEKNAVAILFPYLRSQITLLTAQPSFNPIILPPININALFDGDSDNQE